YPAADPAPRDTIRRIDRMYDGNLQFLALAEAATAHARRAKSLEDAAAADRRRAAAAPGRTEPDAYLHLIERIREAVQGLPAGATVMVVSRGDGRLLELGSRRAWHFPRTD